MIDLALAPLGFESVNRLGYLHHKLRIYPSWPEFRRSSSSMFTKGRDCQRICLESPAHIVYYQSGLKAAANLRLVGKFSVKTRSKDYDLQRLRLSSLGMDGLWKSVSLLKDIEIIYLITDVSRINKHYQSHSSALITITGY